MGRRQYIVIDKTTGRNVGGVYTIDPEKNKSAWKDINKRILNKDKTNRQLVELSLRPVFNPSLHKIVDGKIVEMLPEEINERNKSPLEKRMDALEAMMGI